jgi:hypothetical protein
MEHAFGSVRSVFLAAMSMAAVLTTGADAAPVVSADRGEIVLTDGGKRVVLTHGHVDHDAVLSPDARTILFTRGALAEDETSCSSAVAGKQALMRVDVTSGRVTTLATARSGTKSETQLCNFLDKQFSSDGKRLYFSTPGWVTSGALWMHDVFHHTTSYLLPSNGFQVLANCTAEDYRDKLAVSQHRYFAFGGSFDWYWLFDARGVKQIGPIGETLDMAADTCGIVLPKSGQP